MKRPPIDEVRAAVIAARLTGDVDPGKELSVYWCVTCGALWYHEDDALYATWLCSNHWDKRNQEWDGDYDPKLDTLPLWRKS